MDKVLLKEADLAKIVAERFGENDPKLKTLTGKDLKTPASDLVIRIYLAYLKHMAIEITGIPSHKQTEHLQYVDAYQHVLPHMDLFFILRRIYRRNCVDDFSFFDMTSPTPKRCCYLFSILENFTAYYDMKSDQLADEFSKLEASKKNYEDLKRREELLRQEINKRDTEKYHRERNTAQLEKLCEVKALAINKLLKTRKETSDVLANNEAQLHAEKKKLEEMQDKHLVVTQEIGSLTKLVVPSPDQLTSELKQREELLEATNLEINRCQESIEAKKKQCAWFEMLTGKAMHISKVLQQIKALQQELLQNEAGIDKITSQNSSKSSEVEKCQVSIAKHTQDIFELQLELARRKLQGEKREDSLRKNIKMDEEGLQLLDLKCKEELRQYAALKEQLAAVTADGDKWLKNRVDSENYVETLATKLMKKNQKMYAAIAKNLDAVTADLIPLVEQARKYAEED